MPRPTLQVIIGSTRPGRIGPSLAAWFAAGAVRHGTFEVETVDLADVGLPLLDEAAHPSSGRYENAHTRAWSETISRGDAYVFVVPEYNHSFNAATKNAIDYLHGEWCDKPVGFVSYGGVAAGTRAVQALRPVFLALKAVPVLEAVNVPFVGSMVGADGVFTGNGVLETSAKAMLDELVRRESALRVLRDPQLQAASA